MSRRVVVTGMGAVCALGVGVEPMLASLREQRTGLAPIRYLDTRHRADFVVGEVGLDDDELRARVGVTSTDYGRPALLGMWAAREAMQSAQLTSFDDARTGLVSSTSVAGIARTERVYHLLDAQPEQVGCLDTHDCGDSTERIADHLGIVELVTTVSTACASSANAIALGARLISSGRLDRVLVGGTDALSRFTLNGFNALMILDRARCQPFDRDRRGLNLGEAGAFLMLEAEELAQRRGAPRLAVLAGHGNAADAFHQTASSPEGVGPRLAMVKALTSAGLEPKAIDYVNAHGTGTPNNDLAEGAALRAVFGDQVPKFSSTKGYTGHTLAAAGALEAVVALLAIREQLIFPNLHWRTAMEELPFTPTTTLAQAEVRYVLSNSFGFGGNCTALLFGRP